MACIHNDFQDSLLSRLGSIKLPFNQPLFRAPDYENASPSMWAAWQYAWQHNWAGFLDYAKPKCLKFSASPLGTPPHGSGLINPGEAGRGPNEC